MRKEKLSRPVAAAVVITYLLAALGPDRAVAQSTDCPYDRKAPSLAHARASFQEFDFFCAEREVNDLLKLTSLDTGTKADAHALLAAIYFQSLPDNQNRREKVIEEFRRTYSLRPEWKGQPDVQTPAFRDLMAEARRQVEQLKPKDKPAAPPPEVTTKPQATEPKSEAKRGSKKTWIYVAVGAAAAAVAVVALGGGGSDGGGGGNLPGFPPHPDGKRR